MLFITILTWEPEKMQDVLQVREAIGKFEREGEKILGEWTDLQGGRYFRLFESESPVQKNWFEAVLAVGSFCKLEDVPVIETEVAMDIYRSLK